MLKYFDGYVSCGFKPIAMYLGTKKPVSENWNDNWSASKWRGYFVTEDQKYNMGILLGDIIDVETDNEEANELLNRLIGKISHPAYQSSRSTHHLFLNPDPNLRFSSFHGIEFRGHRVCSVLPPSIHESGIRYRFLKESTFKLSPMPKELLAFYFKNKPVKSKSNRSKSETKPGHTKTICKSCNCSKYRATKRLLLEVKVFSEYFDTSWQCEDCRKVDVRELCRIMRKKLRVEKHHY